MKIALLAACAAVLVAPSYASAQTKEPIEIEASRVTVAQWAADVSRSLDQRIEYPGYIGRRGLETGYAAVSFRVDADGQPTAVVLRRSSGSARLDKAAMRAVSGMQGLAPVPGMKLSSPRVRADIFFATDSITLNDLQRKARREAASLARAPDAANEIAVSVLASATAG